MGSESSSLDKLGLAVLGKLGATGVYHTPHPAGTALHAHAGQNCQSLLAYTSSPLVHRKF